MPSAPAFEPVLHRDRVRARSWPIGLRATRFGAGSPLGRPCGLTRLTLALVAYASVTMALLLEFPPPLVALAQGLHPTGLSLGHWASLASLVPAVVLTSACLLVAAFAFVQAIVAPGMAPGSRQPCARSR
jgi:hypothetical protein